MMLDKKAVEMILTLDDQKLAMIIQKLASDAGIDPSTLKIGTSELSGIRSALSVATDSDLQRAGELIKSYKKGSKE
jgi:hypothetical protein